MKTASKIFTALAVAGQLAALFPFAVMTAAASEEAPSFLFFAVIFAVWTAFRETGWGIGRLAEKIKGGRSSARLHPLINFLARLCCVIPIAAFIAACVILKLRPALYYYALPPSVAMYFGGYSGVGKSYSDVFTKGWFAVYPISALLTSVMLNTGEMSEAALWAGRALCTGFAAEILLFVVMANQANIDKCTKQRDAGKAALPRGLRRYNAVIVAGIFTASLGLFLFARPLGKMLLTAIGAVVGAVVFVVDWISGLLSSSNQSEQHVSEGEISQPNMTAQYGFDLNDLITILIVIAAVILVIIFRKQIWNAFKRAFAAVFRNRGKDFDTPYADEIMSSDAKRHSPRAEKKAERELARQYARETSPKRRYRLGYALFLARLRRTDCPPAPSDTTDIHREKGERVWGADLSGLSEIYSRVRYGDITPNPEELTAEAEILQQLKVRVKR